MKPKRSFFSATTGIVLLACTCVALAFFLVLARPSSLIPVAAVLMLLLLFAFVSLRSLRKRLRNLLNCKSTVEGMAQSGFAALSTPVVVLEGKTIVWYNDAFRGQMTAEEDAIALPISRVVQGLNIRNASSAVGQNLEHGGKKYTVYGNRLNSDDTLQVVFFVENTELKYQAAEYYATRPSVLYIELDTYEVIRELKESAQMRILAGVDQSLEQYIGKAKGFLRRVSASRYVAVVEERYMVKMADAKFEILNTVRRLDSEGSAVTLSVGVGRLGETLKQCDEMAQRALDMALGRGGDQVAVNSPDGFIFYGGVSGSVEKRERVKSRIMANSIRELVQNSELVLIMGHKNADMDSLGAAVGMLRFCKICQKPAAIVLNQKQTLAQSLVDILNEAGYGDDILSPEVALPLAGENTLLVVVDTHMKYLLESAEIYEASERVVVIDHHRRMVGHIANATLFYHEPYASSASELVSELLQYLEGAENLKPTAVEADALLAGITLDTRTFSLHVGVRTFEAAAYLRRLGARTDAVKKLFSSSLSDYVHRSHMVEQAHVYRGCAVVVSGDIQADSEVVAPQAANDLLSIEGVKASVVAIQTRDQIRVSARSMGEVNVQLIMEELGGGGHLTMAGAQLKGVDLEEGKAMILDAIDAYYTQREGAE